MPNYWARIWRRSSDAPISASVLACLRAKTVEQVLFALPSGEPQFAETTRAPWGPVVDGLEIPDQPRRLYEIGKFSRVPVVIEHPATKEKSTSIEAFRLA